LLTLLQIHTTLTYSFFLFCTNSFFVQILSSWCMNAYSSFFNYFQASEEAFPFRMTTCLVFDLGLHNYLTPFRIWNSSFLLHKSPPLANFWYFSDAQSLWTLTMHYYSCIMHFS
jgi:hypothetical protein